MKLCGRDKTQKNTITITGILEMFKYNQLNENHKLQRRAGRWPKEYESDFIATIMLNEDFDPIKICEQIFDDHYILWLIDGLQRLSTIRSFANNNIMIQKTLDPDFSIINYQQDNTGKIVEFDIRGKRFKDLPPELQRKFNNYNVDMVKHLDCSDKEIARHMKRYNHNAPMNANERNFTYLINVAEAIKNISQNNVFFKDCGNYNDFEEKKGIKERVVIESIMLLFHFDCWTKGKNMNIFLNDNASDVEFKIFEDELNRLAKVVNHDTTGQLFNSKNSFIWFGAFHKFIELGLEDKRFADFLAAFQDNLHSKPFDEYDGESFDTYDSGKGTKDKKVVAVKLDMLEKLMKEYFNMVDEQPVEEVAVEAVENITDEQEVVEAVNKHVEETKVAASEEIEENTIVEPHARTAEEIENDHILAFVQAEVDPGIEMEDVIMYKDFFDDYVRDDSHVKTVGNAVLVAMLAYAFQIERDNDLSDWLDIIGKRDDRYSQNDYTNFTYFKRDFDKYLAGLDGKNAA